MIRVSVLVPAYNEQATILKTLESAAAQRIEGVEFEVIVIDDGSKDQTVPLLEANPHLYAKLIKQPKNGGKGAAVKAGLEKATGEYVLFQDADLEYDPADWEKLLKPVTLFDADIVYGSRFVAPEYTRVFYFWHKIGNGIITLFFNILNNTTFTDIYSCYLMYRRRLVDVDSLVSLGWEQQAEILSRAVANAESMYEVPISYHGRSYAEGKKIKSYHAIVVLWTIFLRRFFR